MSGKVGRNRKHAAKMARKRATKDARRAAYAALAGTSSKNKRVNRTKSTSAGPLKHAHAMVDCGNPGCKRCNPRPLRADEYQPGKTRRQVGSKAVSHASCGH